MMNILKKSHRHEVLQPLNEGIVGIDLGLLMYEMCATLEEHVEKVLFFLVESTSQLGSRVQR